MNAFVGCILGMMVGTIVLVWAVIQQPHTHINWPNKNTVMVCQ